MEAKLRFFVRCIDQTGKWLFMASSVLIPIMVCVLAFEVVARDLFHRPTIWAHEMAVFLFGYAGLLGGAYLLNQNKHINVDIIYQRLTPRSRAFLDLITCFVTMFFVILMIIYGWKIAMMAVNNGERSPSEWGPPTWHFKFVIVVAGLLVLLQAVAKSIRNFYRAVFNRELET